MTQEDRVHRVRVLRRALNAWLRDPGKFLGWLQVVSGLIDKIAGARAAGNDAWVTTQTQAAQTALTNAHAAEQAELQDRQDVQTAFNQHHTVAPSVEGFVPSAADTAVLTQEPVDLGYSQDDAALLSGLFSSLTPSEGKWPLGSTDDAAIPAGTISPPRSSRPSAPTDAEMTWDELQLRANLGLGLDEPLPLYRLCPGCGDRILTLGPHDCWVATKEHD